MRPWTCLLIYIFTLLFTVGMTYGQCYDNIGVPDLEIQTDSSSQNNAQYCPYSGGLCPSMLSHLLSLLILTILLVIDNITNPIQQPQYRCLDYLILVTSLSLFTTMVIYYYYYVTDFYLALDAKEKGCVLKMPFVDFFSGLLFSFYTLFVISGVMICCYGFYQLFYGIRKRDKTQKKLTKLLENVYYDKDEIKKFYERNNEKLINVPLYPIEMLVFRDQFEKEFRYIEKKEYDECCICFFEGFKESDKVISFPGCGHNFHFDCLKAWLKKRTFCPVCRSEFREHFATDLASKMENEFVKVSSLDNGSN